MGRLAVGMRAARSRDKGLYWERLAGELLGGKSQRSLFTQPWLRAMERSKHWKQWKNKKLKGSAAAKGPRPATMPPGTAASSGH